MNNVIHFRRCCLSVKEEESYQLQNISFGEILPIYCQVRKQIFLFLSYVVGIISANVSVAS